MYNKLQNNLRALNEFFHSSNYVKFVPNSFIYVGNLLSKIKDLRTFLFPYFLTSFIHRNEWIRFP